MSAGATVASFEQQLVQERLSSQWNSNESQLDTVTACVDDSVEQQLVEEKLSQGNESQLDTSFFGTLLFCILLPLIWLFFLCSILYLFLKNLIIVPSWLEV